MAPSRLRLTTSVVAVALIGAAAVLVSWRYLFRFPNETMADLEVYARAGDAVRHGRHVYENVDSQLVFTYPPFAALVAAVVAPVTDWWGQFLWTLATVVALVGVVLLSFRPLLQRCRADWRPLALGALVAVALLTHPMIEHIFYGQVNVFLVLFCLLDVIGLNSRRAQGALVGVATAVKLTPGVFGIYLWITGRRRAALVALTALAGATLLAFVVMPSSSVDFWTHDLFDGRRVAGSVTYTSNQSLYGVIARVLPGGISTAAWVVVALAVAIVGFTRARAAHAAGDDRGGIALTALLAVLLSPIAWIHHLVWFLPAVGALVADGRDRRRVLAAAAVTIVLLLRLPWWGWAMLDDGPIPAFFGVLMHNAYALMALLIVLGYPVRRANDARTPVDSGHGRTWRNGTDRAVPARS